MVFDGHSGQLVASTDTLAAPDDIPSIVERYIGLVGRVIKEMETKESFQSRDINSVAAIGRAVAMLQASEEMRISRVGGRAVKEIPTAQLRKLLANSENPYETPEGSENE